MMLLKIEINLGNIIIWKRIGSMILEEKIIENLVLNLV